MLSCLSGKLLMALDRLFATTAVFALQPQAPCIAFRKAQPVRGFSPNHQASRQRMMPRDADSNRGVSTETHGPPIVRCRAVRPSIDSHTGTRHSCSTEPPAQATPTSHIHKQTSALLCEIENNHLCQTRAQEPLQAKACGFHGASICDLQRHVGPSLDTDRQGGPDAPHRTTDDKKYGAEPPALHRWKRPMSGT